MCVIDWDITDVSDFWIFVKNSSVGHEPTHETDHETDYEPTNEQT